MTDVLLLLSAAANVVLFLAALRHRHRARAEAVARCAACPFVRAAAPLLRIPAAAARPRTPLPVLNGAA